MIKRILFALAVLVGLSAFAQSKEDWKTLKAPINLFVANDLGRNGYYEQKTMAELMGEMAEIIEPEAMLALGDVHHFMGVQSIYDPLWTSNYENVYSHPELQIEWLPILGNHEYRGNTQAVVDYSSLSRRWEMPAKYYSRTFTGKGATVKVVFIDTTPLIDKYRNNPDEYPDAAGEDMEDQLQWLDNELANATEDWIVVAGHHPIYADTPKDDSERSDMQKRVDEVLRKHTVDMYLCGHIHNFQHINHDGIDYIVNSSASQSRKKVGKVEGSVFVNGDTGFSVLGADKSKLSLSMIDRNGKVIHQVTRTK